jgi:putative lipoic acid-binding regulatory protein
MNTTDADKNLSHDGWTTAAPEKLYPVECHFRIIVEQAFAKEDDLKQILSASEVTAPLAPGSVSSGGKYRSLQVGVRVHGREEMDRLDRAIRAVPGVRMLL